MNEPSLLVALPNAVRELVGPGRLPDVSIFLAEWAALLDPPAALAAAATLDGEGVRNWLIGGRATPSSTVLRHLRDASKRDDVEPLLRSLTPARGEDGIDPRALPFLLGLAVAAALRAGVGVASHGAREELRARRNVPQAAEQCGASDAGASEAALGSSTTEARQ